MTERIDSGSAIANKKRAGASWGRAHDRLEGHVSPLINPSFTFTPGARIFTIGSCFARNIEDRLADAGFDLPMLRFRVPAEEYPGHPRGIMNKYTPAAIWQEVSWAAGIHARDDRMTAADIAPFRYPCSNGSVIDTNLGGFNPVTPERFTARRGEVYAIYRDLFAADYMVLTLGLIEAWFDKSAARYVQQAPIGRHFPDATRFQFEVLSYASCLGFIADTFDLVRRINPKLRILLTTSPVPLGRTFTGDDVLIANMHSKSVLRALCGELCGNCDFADYFPSYESAVLTKSWDVWEEDKRHVSTAFVGRIIDQMAAHYFKT